MSKISNFVEYSSDVEHKNYTKEVKQNNLNIIGSRSESPLEVDSYKGTVTGNKMRIVGRTGTNDWCIFLMEVKVKGGTFNGTLDRIPFNPEIIYKKTSVIKFEIYTDKNNLKRGRIIE